MHVFVTDRNARRIAPYIEKQWTSTLLGNTAELTVLLREGRGCASSAEHTSIRAIYPESLTLYGLDAQTSSLWYAINVCRLRKLVLVKIHWLSSEIIQLIDSCNATLASLEISSSADGCVISHLPLDYRLPELTMLKDFRLKFCGLNAMSEECMRRLVMLARSSTLMSLAVEGLRYDQIHWLILNSRKTLAALELGKWFSTFSDHTPHLRTLHANIIKHEDGRETVMPLNLRCLTTRLQQSPFDDGTEICELLENHNFGPSLTHITLQAHHTQSRNADAVKWQRVRRQPLRRAVLARLLLSCRMRGMTLRYDSGPDPIDYADDCDPYSDKSSYLIDDVPSFSTI